VEALKCKGLIKKPQIYSPHSAKENAMSGFMSLTWIYVLVWGKIVVTSTINVLFLFIYSFIYLRVFTSYNTFLYSIHTFHHQILSITTVRNSINKIYRPLVLYISCRLSIFYRIESTFYIYSVSRRISRINFTRLDKINYFDQRNKKWILLISFYNLSR